MSTRQNADIRLSGSVVNRAQMYGTELQAPADMDASFGPFHVDIAGQALWRGDERLVLGHRAFAILCALIERPGHLVPKVDLFDRAWPGISVDEANLRVQVSALRKALGEHGPEIQSVTGLGYRFVGQLNNLTEAAAAVPLTRLQAPIALDEPLGRQAALAAITLLLRARRLVTVVGPGGIGKTTLALLLARDLDIAFADGSCFVDLSLVSDPQLVPAALATALQQPVGTGDIMAAVIACVRNQSLLIILDCCEHVIEAAARAAEQLLAAGPDLRIVATSREALRAQSEWIEHLDPLETPLSKNALTAAQALTYPAVQLLERSAKSGAKAFTLTNQNVALAVDICRRLDGIPLAIELAGSLTGTLGLAAVLDGLDQRFSLLSFGRRASLPRHQTLAATMAWSYDLLTENQRAVLRRLATFVGRFSVAAAAEVATGDHIDGAEALRCIVDLASKSLLAVDLRRSAPEYRLLETTRAYARLQSAPEGERDQAALRHARYHLDLLSAKDWETYDPLRERTKVAGQLEEVRIALDWAYGQADELSLAVNLTIAAERAWVELAWVAEGLLRLNQALVGLDKDSTPDARLKMQVLAALGTAFVNAQDSERGEVLFGEALRLAERLDDRSYQLRALWGLIYHHITTRNAFLALELAQRFQALALERPFDPEAEIADHLLGCCYLEVGQIKLARTHLEAFLAAYTTPPRAHAAAFGFDKRVTAHAGLGVALWIQGYPLQARKEEEAALAVAKQRRHAASTFYALAYGACLITLLVWDLPAARRHLHALDQVAQQYPAWQTWALAYRGMLERREGNLSRARRCLEEALGRDTPLKLGSLYPLLLVDLADIRRLTGDLDGAVAAADLTLACQKGPGDVIVICHALRAKAEALAARDDALSSKTAEALFNDSIELARTQDGLVFELAAAVGLARLWRSSGRSSEALRLLGPILDRIPDGHDLAPAREAQALFDDLTRHTGVGA